MSSQDRFIQPAPVEWRAFPNPISGQVSITYQSTKDQRTLLQLNDVSGHLVLSKQVELKKGENRINWDINAVTTGVYFITLKLQGIAPLKIVKD